jgi:ribosomal protein S18 acetylase RimI-like enzyme
MLMVSRDCQRQGIGTLLLDAGLREADDAGLQCILGASPEGQGLYKKYGFVEFEQMSLNLWEYDGGEGMGVVNHCIMHRRAKSR